MNNTVYTEYIEVLNRLSECALTEKTKEKILNLKPFLKETECINAVRDTSEARKVLDAQGTPPLPAIKELDRIFMMVSKGDMLLPEYLNMINQFIISCRRMQSYLKKAELLYVSIASFSNSFYDLDALFEEIDIAIRHDMVDDNASAYLKGLRKKIMKAETAVKEKMESILKSKKGWFADSYVTSRKGRLVLPVKKEYKNQIEGSVIEISNTGGSYFIEPAAVRKLQDELDILKIEEENEVRRILYVLTAKVEEFMPQLAINKECIETLDFFFAKGKLSQKLNGTEPEITVKRIIDIKGGRHPFIRWEDCVPVDFKIGGEIKGVVITGPNTGGKTVSLKTVGLLSLMAQTGLHVSAGIGSIFTMNYNVLSDIGDSQSIAANLSTFSGHITNVIHILKNTSHESLVLLDELGSGTDPQEGMGIAVSILEELIRKKCLFAATTHYPEIKELAGNTQGLVNARMEFDKKTLKPLYKLTIGEAGESCALDIAKDLGFPDHLLERARAASYGQKELICIPPIELEQGEEMRPAGNIIKNEYKGPVNIKSSLFRLGDSVMVHPESKIGIVFCEADEKGNVGVQIKQKKIYVNHRRLQLQISAEKLYPDNYDLDIIFQDADTRKARKKMSKKHQPGLAIEYNEND